MQNGTDLPVVIGGLVTIIGGFYGIAKVMLSQAAKDREADRTERKEFVDAIRAMAASSDQVAQATIRGADEAKERNGHLAELVLQGNKLVEKDVQINSGIRASLEKSAIIAAEDRDSLTRPVSQHIENQIVDTQVIKDKL